MIESGSFAVACSLVLALFWRRAICYGDLTTTPTGKYISHCGFLVDNFKIVLLQMTATPNLT